MELPILIETVFKHLRDFEPNGPAVTVPSRFVNGIASVPVRYKAA
jgi:cytochrome P450